jgi:C-terminal processing protease CtpA/Prc
MNPIRTSIVTSAAITIAALVVVFGSVSRGRLDLGAGAQALNSGPSLTDLVASRAQVPEGDYFREMVRLLKREYVEPITDDQKLAVGAVKGMIDSLKDPHSTFMDPNEFKAYNNSVEGKYEGIGADLAFDMDSGKGNGSPADAQDMDPNGMQSLALPKLVVISVTPGGPAAEAGVKPGDWVESVEDHWVLGPEPIQQYRKAVMAANAKETAGLPSDVVVQREKVARTLGVALRAKLKTMIMPLKAMDMINLGDSGSMKIEWHRGPGLRDTVIQKHESHVPIVDADASTIALRFADGSAKQLKEAIAGKGDITLDLRNDAVGDFNAMQQCLAVVAPSGDYGEIDSDKPGKARQFVVANGNPKPPRMTILVDRSTRGPAEIFAHALSSRKLADVSGKASGDETVVEVVSLPDGSGYTLTTGEYKPFPSKQVATRSAMKEKTRRSSVALRDSDGTMVAAGKFKGGNA